MCDYCDCRSHPQIASLSVDHEEMLGLLIALQSVVDGADRQRAQAVIARLGALLDRHATREDRGIFTELIHAAVDRDYVARFEHDHEHIHGLLAEAAGGEWQAPANELIGVLGDHIAREETDLFPAAHQLLRPDQWDAVDAVDAELAEAAT
jgi:hemerythrin-like domain-containing protein